MRAKSKLILTSVVLATFWLTTSTSASDHSMDERCSYLSSLDPGQIHKALTTFSGTVMGKYPEHWTSTDYSNIAANAQVCNGLPINAKRKVNAKYWISKLGDAEEKNMEINSISLAIKQAYSQYWNSDEEFPACTTFLKWERDDVWYTNNAEKLFGSDFHEMTTLQKSLYRRLAQECVPVMEKVLQRWRITPEKALGFSKSILFSIDLESDENLQKSEAIPDNLKIYRNGRQIPISYLRESTQNVLNRIAELEINDRVMPTNALIQISKWATQVISEKENSPDKLYAQKIRNIIADHMFKAGGHMR